MDDYVYLFNCIFHLYGTEMKGLLFVEYQKAGDDCGDAVNSFPISIKINV
jgi:hypothetical protein